MDTSRRASCLGLMLASAVACSSDSASPSGAPDAGTPTPVAGQPAPLPAGRDSPPAAGDTAAGASGAATGGGGAPSPAPDAVDLDPAAGNTGFTLPDCGRSLGFEGELCGTGASPCAVLADETLPVALARFPPLSFAPGVDRVHVVSTEGYTARQGGSWSAPEALPDEWTGPYGAAVDAAGTLFTTRYVHDALTSPLMRRTGNGWESAGDLPVGFVARTENALLASERCLHAAVELDLDVDRARGGPAYAVYDGTWQAFALGPRIQLTVIGVGRTSHTIGPDGRAHLAYRRAPDSTLYWARPPSELEVVRAVTPGEGLGRVTPLAVAADAADEAAFVVYVVWSWGGSADLQPGVRLSTRTKDGAWIESTVVDNPPADPSSCGLSATKTGPCDVPVTRSEPLAVFASAGGGVRVLMLRTTQIQSFSWSCPQPGSPMCVSQPNLCNRCGPIAMPGELVVAELVLAAGQPSALSEQAVVALEWPFVAQDVAVRLGPDGHIHVTVPLDQSIRYLELGPR